MRIQLKKGKNDRPSTLTCIRDDGSLSWVHEHTGQELHDLAHYAVEEELGSREGFYGLVNNGYNISDFSKPNHEKPQALSGAQLPLEAQHVEHIVNLVQVASQEEKDLSFVDVLQKTLLDHGLPPVQNLDTARFERILRHYDQLVIKWGGLAEGQCLELEFPSKPK